MGPQIGNGTVAQQQQAKALFPRARSAPPALLHTAGPVRPGPAPAFADPPARRIRAFQHPKGPARTGPTSGPAAGRSTRAPPQGPTAAAGNTQAGQAVVGRLNRRGIDAQAVVEGTVIVEEQVDHSQPSRARIRFTISMAPWRTRSPCCRPWSRPARWPARWFR